MQRCSNRISQALKHLTGKGRTAPHTKRSQGSSQHKTNTLMPKKPESASSITLPNYQGLMAGSRTSAGKRPGCWPPWSCQGLNCFPTTPLSRISQTPHFPSAVPSFTLDYTHKAPCISHPPLGAPGNRAQNSSTQQANPWPTAATDPAGQSEALPVPPCTGTIPWNQHFLSFIPELPKQQAWQVKLTTHCSAPFQGKSDPGARELLWSSAEPQEMQTSCDKDDTPRGNDPQGLTTTTVCSS